MGVEELDQGAHEEGGDDGADARDGGNQAPGAAGHQEDTHAQGHAHQIAADTHILELAQLPLPGQDDGHGVIGGDAQVGGHVQGGAEADHHDAHQQAQSPDDHGRIGQDDLQPLVGELGDVAQQEQVDKGGDADIMTVSHQAEHQQGQVHQHVQSAEGNGDPVVQTAHQGLERVNAQGRDLEDAHADGADQHTGQGHQNSSCFHKFSFSLCQSLMICRSDCIMAGGIYQ